MKNDEWVKIEKKKLSPSVLAFAEKRCEENRRRIEREQQGNYGQCIHIVSGRKEK